MAQARSVGNKYKIIKFTIYFFQHFHELVMSHSICMYMLNNCNNCIHDVFHRVCFREWSTNIFSMYHTLIWSHQKNISLLFLKFQEIQNFDLTAGVLIYFFIFNWISSLTDVKDSKISMPQFFRLRIVFSFFGKYNSTVRQNTPKVLIRHVLYHMNHRKLKKSTCNISNFWIN